MSTITTLLVDIEHPDLDEPLYLMCGRDFSVLRTDNTGRDIYGFAHEGREYLLAPFSIETADENRLIMTLPASYEEWFAGLGLDGARIRFSSPHGEPVFAHLPDEYRSGSGLLGIDDQGRIHISLDKADPACIRANRPARPKPASPCACGHDHHHNHDERSPAHEHTDHQHEHRVRFQIGMTDQELADTIRKRVDGLNLLLRQAAESGLEVDVALATEAAPEFPQLTVRKIARLL